MLSRFFCNAFRCPLNLRAIAPAALLVSIALGAAPALASGAAAAPASSADEDPMIHDAHYDDRVACETGDGAACFDLGRAYETRFDLWGKPVSNGVVRADDRKAAHYFRRACDAGREQGCSSLSRLYELGKGVTRNPREATRLRAQACALGADKGCGAAAMAAD